MLELPEILSQTFPILFMNRKTLKEVEIKLKNRFQPLTLLCFNKCQIKNNSIIDRNQENIWKYDDFIFENRQSVINDKNPIIRIQKVHLEMLTFIASSCI